ncbi:hypothetical protein ACWD6U_27100, partial [Streptomyces sp. NPDC005149]
SSVFFFFFFCFFPIPPASGESSMGLVRGQGQSHRPQVLHPYIADADMWFPHAKDASHAQQASQGESSEAPVTFRP